MQVTYKLVTRLNLPGSPLSSDRLDVPGESVKVTRALLRASTVLMDWQISHSTVTTVFEL